jgi:hypothetical protein
MAARVDPERGRNRLSQAGWSVVLKFVFGALGSIVAGFAIFRFEIFDPSRPAIQCITIGVLTAGLLGTVRAGYPRAALGLVVMFAAMRIGEAKAVGWPAALQSTTVALLLGGGIFIVAVIYDQLAERGIRIGKFLLVGPLVGGLYLGLTPLSDFSTMNALDPAQNWLFNAFLGVVIGDGVGAGFEVTELLIDPATRPAPAPVRERPDRWAL